MVVLSLFDGMSCGQIALKELGIKVDKYYASEIDKFAIAQTQLNFPDTIQLGSVVDVDVSKLDRIDLLLGGSPCQSFSFAGKRKGMSTKCNEEIYTLERYLKLKEDGFEFEGQSYLFWEYMRILNDIRKYNPDVKFLLENVEMGNKWERVLSEAIGVFGVHINSALVSAQNRKRIYWTNIRTKEVGLFGEVHSDIPQPEDRGILLRDIFESEVDEKYYLSDAVIDKLIKHRDRHKEQGHGFGAVFHEENAKMQSLKIGGKGIDDLIIQRQRGNNKGNVFEDKTPTLSANSREQNNIVIQNNNKSKSVFYENISKERRSREILLRLQQEVVSQKDVQWEMGVYARFFTEEILFDRMYERILQTKREAAKNDKEWKISSTKESRNGVVSDMQEKTRNRCASYRQKSAKQFIRELAEIMQVLSQQDTSTKGGVQDLRESGQRLWILRKALSAIQEIWGSPIDEGESIHSNNKSSRIRRLTPTEAARLQTVPDWYKWECSETQQYRMLGNGWTIKVIMHILKYLDYDRTLN